MTFNIFGTIRAAAISAVFISCLSAADYQVIASKDVKTDSISSDDLKRVFLLSKTSLADGSRVAPVLLQSGAAHQAFLKQCLGKSDADLQSHYQSLVFTGKASTPRAMASDAEVISFVAMSKGAVGYVSATAIPMGVKKLELK